jgi:uncharacterized protein (TIGR02099 family)
MPSEPVPPSASGQRSRASRVLRFIGASVLFGLGAFCALLLAIRFVVFPRIDAHRGDIAALIAGELKHPVEIDAIATGWDGWNPQLTVKGLRVLEAQPSGRPLVELPSVTGAVAWTSLLAAEVRLKELVIERPSLAVSRDTAGRIHVAGIEIDPRSSSSAAFAEWLFRQPLIVVKDAVVAWRDELRNAPQLVLNDVELRLENGFRQHRFGVRGRPAAGIASPIDLRGDFVTTSPSDWKAARGTLYVRLDYADVAVWTGWLPIDVPVESGIGAMRAWLTFAGGEARNVVADVELADVRTRLGDALPPLDLERVGGRVSWKSEGARRTFAARALSFTSRNGVAVAPTTLEVRYDVGADGDANGGRVVFDQLELGPLSALAAQLPLPQRFRDDLERYAPRGTLSEAEYVWQGRLRDPQGFRARAAFGDVGVNAHASFPGLQRISGSFEATHAGGTLRVASRNAAIALPAVLHEPIGLDTFAGSVTWERSNEGALRLRLDDIEYANAHAAGTAQGTWRSTPKGPGEIDLTARLTRGDVRHVDRYLPKFVGDKTRRWLQQSVVAGTSDDTRLTLKGDLAKFPFPDAREGTFVVAIKGRNATLDYAHQWPRLTEVDADVRFEGRRLSIIATRGNVLGAAIGRTTAVIPDLDADEPVLTVQGEATGPTAEFLRFVELTPVAGWIGRFTDGARASGNGRLALKLELDLANVDAGARVAGDYQFTDNELRLAGAPALSHVNGRITFTEQDVSARDITAEVFGGPARLEVTSQSGAVRVSGTGTLNLAALRDQLPSAYAERVSGATDWHANLLVRPKFASWTIESSLRGAAIDLPKPLGKLASEAVPLKIDRRAMANDASRDAFVIDYGSALRIVAHRKLAGQTADVDRALVLLGKAIAKGGEPERDGVALRGDIASVDVDPWLELAQAAPGRDGTAAPGLELQSIDLEAGALTALGRRYDQVSVSARRSPSAWRARFSSKQMEGTGSWEPAGSARANGRLTAQLARLALAPDDKSSPQPPKPIEPRAEGSANPWPEVEISAERFIGRSGNTLGRMELAARPEGTDWRVTRFALANDAGRIDANGSWRLVGRQQQTRFDVAIDVRDSASFLATAGLPNDVKGAPAKLEGQLAWNGAPTDFDYPALSGTFRVSVGAGQFTRIDPGVGKLLGVLSLQALPRRITLDFRDVFSEGFAFDSIQGSVRITQGVMHTDSLLLNGPAATVQLAGDVDLERETQALTVRVQPALSTTVSAGAGAAAVALLAANPLIGAAVGAGTLLAQKLMQDPIEQMFSYEYAVRGSWSEPVVERVRGRAFGADAKTEASAR